MWDCMVVDLELISLQNVVEHQYVQFWKHRFLFLLGPVSKWVSVSSWVHCFESLRTLSHSEGSSLEGTCRVIVRESAFTCDSCAMENLGFLISSFMLWLRTSTVMTVHVRVHDCNRRIIISSGKTYLYTRCFGNLFGETKMQQCVCV